MSLKEDGKYDDMEAFKKVPITNEWTLLEQGVEAIHHTSKEMILKRVKTNEPSDTGVPKQG